MRAVHAPPVRGNAFFLVTTSKFPPLPPAIHADTETVTNVPFTVALDVVGRLSFDLVCRATPSNNVEVAFGRDADGNGMLDVGEEAHTVGWDCGA